MTNTFSPSQLGQALPLAIKKMNPKSLINVPVMFLVEVGAAFTFILAIAHPSLFTWSITVWLWLTVLFATLAEAVAEGRGKAQADSLRASRTETTAVKFTGDAAPGNLQKALEGPEGRNGHTEDIAGDALTPGDIVLVTAGEIIPADGDVIFGAATVDESAVTGESAPVIRESGGDRSAVTGGTRVLSDGVAVKVTSRPGESFMDRMIGLVEGAQRKKTPNELALGTLLHVLTLIFLIVVIALAPMAAFNGAEQSPVVLVALLVCLIPTTIGALLSAIGIAGMDRLVQHNVLAMSGRAVEAAGDVATLLLDKTGTITIGDRQASEFVPAGKTDPEQLAYDCQLASLADETPEGRSIVALSQKTTSAIPESDYAQATFIPFSAQTRMSGIELPDQDRKVLKGAASEVCGMVEKAGGTIPEGTNEIVNDISNNGGTALVVAEVCGANHKSDPESSRVLGVIHLKDVVKPGMTERFQQLRKMGIRTVMITGDNALTAHAIAKEAGVDDVLAEATPEDKLALIRKEQAKGRLVAMTGDGTNDAPALAQADVGVAMNTGTTAAKEAGNMVDLDSDPTKLIDIVGIGKQLLITRGALTTFSIANDIAKYFAIIPAMFVVAFPGLDKLNIMRLHSPESAILSAVIFNALVIIALIPLALKGVKYRAGSAASLLSRNLTIFGLGGVIVPFVGIKIIDLLLSGVFGL
ncbi:potassium-transporting ATPase subunit B [Corynebacterium falsenii DSM 44353]|uniref:Potassium-transporting ATPase ATP-binding subunit n=1 Tax=Corynebacterium falsenii TaxID=108486 RepID=A0A418Q700_9CORY|nr:MULTISPECIES: potassium-transporting ATPase subunit KdpB [Corynebacterium]AHI03372.1 potassium-transporting ATPase subunit B [Corynebacterium falsenii DSM 44353]MDC7103293.1 potassium-transporting ATPase subunit KdpB [Corynebacterium falsenii]RIX34887.1 K(+)-transporting ATPase subunit B [Corynebacterium falsenii]UBI04064.1 potassium-transporting ATPase subunit KdpB [Corynebacterium falsenii]UBI05922.1 potassium-transporting ATPase subunit KdpB [Corynebacterium falsenii]